MHAPGVCNHRLFFTDPGVFIPADGLRGVLECQQTPFVRASVCYWCGPFLLYVNIQLDKGV